MNRFEAFKALADGTRLSNIKWDNTYTLYIKADGHLYYSLFDKEQGRTSLHLDEEEGYFVLSGEFTSEPRNNELIEQLTRLNAMLNKRNLIMKQALELYAKESLYGDLARNALNWSKV